ncbi:MAG: type I DNA topoisomerase [Ardenticatenia bacterium]|nr:MAG: type I DNA topoisomerase [Ardenticatenia bacterium]
METLTAYCVKCRAKRPMRDPQPSYTASGRPCTQGVCPECGTTLFKMGRTPAHAALPAPPALPAEKHANRTTRRAKAVSATRDKERVSSDGRPLVIVESPAKARTVGKFLGSGYTVKASVGHVRDLLRSQLSVDVEHDFAPRYRVPKEKRQIVEELKAAVKRAPEVYLATDPDREGEAIAWHLMEAAEIPPQAARRVVFHEITQQAIQEAFSHPQQIDMNRVNAQQARRILDRLVGYKLSPLLWEKVRNRTSAGRVQSVAVRLIVEREREIAAFVPEEYWSIAAELARRVAERPSFIAKLVKIAGQAVELKNQAAVQPVLEELERSLYLVVDVRRGERRRKPAPPFTTSTMQQEASRRLGFTAARTMRIAQQLYEGIDLGAEGSVGLITYMRTDSTNVAIAAQEEARAFIAARYGPTALPPTPPIYKTKAKGAQEAHEAIRPTSVLREPEKVKPFLSAEQWRLYTLIWQRFVASQMAPAIYDTMTVEVAADPAWHETTFASEAFQSTARWERLAAEARYLLRASGSRVRVPGFLAVYEESRDEDATPEEGEQMLPEVHVGELLDLVRLLPEQHFTQPPPRYTEATLVRALEEYGIGRPSTYAPIISTIQERGYVTSVDRRLYPTELGFIVNDLLVEHFPDIVNVDFTARMEEDLDRIARGEQEWVPVLRAFYTPFEQALQRAERLMAKVEMAEPLTGENCERCGHPMVVKWGRFGKFIACSNYPACRNTKPYLEKTGATCPQCGGDLVERRTRRKRIFYGCANYPTCNFTSWKRPLPQPCPECGGLLVVANQRTAQCLQCGARVSMEHVTSSAAPAELPAAEATLVAGDS